MVLTLAREGSRALGSALRQTLDMMLYPDRMQRAEAMKILNLDHGYTERELNSNFSRFYSANAVKNGGSAYLQEKIKDAFTVIRDGEHARPSK